MHTPDKLRGGRCGVLHPKTHEVLVCLTHEGKCGTSRQEGWTLEAGRHVEGWDECKQTFGIKKKVTVLIYIYFSFITNEFQF